MKVVETSTTFDEAASIVRGDIELQGARRWLRRRISRINLFSSLIQVMLGTSHVPLDPFIFRHSHPDFHSLLPTPIGLSHRHIGHWGLQKSNQHSMGPEKPP